MRILLINYEYPPIGGATNTHNIAKHLATMGHNVYVLTAAFQNLKGWSHKDGISLYRCRVLRKNERQSNIIEMLTFVISAGFILPRFIKKHSIQAMIVFFSVPCGPLGLWGKITSDIPYVVSLLGGDVPGNDKSLNLLHSLITPLRRLVLKKSLAVIANSEGLKKVSMAADPSQIQVIPNGIDTTFFRPSGKKYDNTTFLSVGRFQQQKNLFFLLEQMNIIAVREKVLFDLIIIGNGPQEKSLKNFAQRLEIRNRINWHNWCSQKELKSYYQKAHCLLHPSLSEGMPNVVIEAMACGTAVIASNIPGNNDLVEHKKNGFLFDLEKSDQFSNAVISIIHDRDLAISMGMNGRNMVKKSFSWERTVAQYLNLFNI